MDKQDEQLFIKKAFQTLMDKGWIKGPLKPASITSEDIEELENKYNIELPDLYKTFLMTYQH